MMLRVHNALDRAQRHCKAFAQSAQPGEVCFCIGPGGAGKTSLARRLGPGVYGQPGQWPANSQPYAYVEADLSDRGYFNPKSFTRACLSAIMDPFRAESEEVAQWNIASEIKRAVQSYSLRTTRISMGEPEMRLAFVNVASLLGVKTLIVDEANLLVLTQRGRVPTDYLEGIRRLGDQIGCNVLLFGTLRLLELTGHSAQLNRRSDYVHIDRMRCSDAEQQRDFRVFLKAMETDHLLPKGLLDTRSKSIFEWTYGIPGEVVGLLHRANRLRQVDGAETLSWDHVTRAKHHVRVIDQIRQEANLIQGFFEGEEAAPKHSAKKLIARGHDKRGQTKNSEHRCAPACHS